MKNLKKILIISVLAFLSMVFPSLANAAPLEVTFTPPTLFSEASFMPGDDASGVVNVTNNSGALQTVLTEAINITDSDNFGSMLQLVIKEGSNTLFNDSLATFFSTAGEVTLGSISNGESKTFDFNVSFTGADNAYQEKSLGFDVCVGFQGGTIHCGDTAVGDEDGDGDGGGTITGGGGGGGGINFIPLTISSEQEQNINLILNQITITWNTNKLATSQVVYGPNTSTYTLDLDAPNFGYPFSTIEDPTKVLLHSVTLTGLSPGQTYVYRVVSRASPPTISAEGKFSIPLSSDTDSPLALNNQSDIDQTFSGGPSSGDGAQNNTGSPGSVLGTSTVNENILNLDEEGAEENALTNGDEGLALALSSGFKNFNYWYLFLLIILILLYLSWRYWRNKNK